MIGKLAVIVIAAVTVVAAAGGALSILYLMQNPSSPQLSMPIKAGTVLHYGKETFVYAFFTVSNASGGTLIGSWNATAPVWVVIGSVGKNWSIANFAWSTRAPAHVPTYENYHLYFQKGKYVVVFIMRANVTLTIEQTMQVISAS